MRAPLFLALFAALSVSAGSSAAAAVRACPHGDETVVYTQTGLASWYLPQRSKHRTASGQRSHPTALTAAHRTLPFGSIVHVTNLENCRSVAVTVTDRGPFGRRHRGRIVDLSKSAATALGIRGAGIARVRLERYTSD
jgi:rare lipoprotein A